LTSTFRQENFRKPVGTSIKIDGKEVFTMNRIITIVTTLVFAMLVFVSTASAQVKIVPGIVPVDTANNPHDFNDRYYRANGVVGKSIIWRRTGSDGLSVFSKTSNPNHTPVRVIVTVPAYTVDGLVSLWYPLGELTNAGFTDDKIGIFARETAKLFPMYIFPDEKYINYNTIIATRQAPVIDNTWAQNAGALNLNPLGIREIFMVKYTEKAHGPEGVKMMEYMATKNGYGTDKMPIINTVSDVRMLFDEGYIVIGAPGEGPDRGHYAIAPMIDASVPGVIAKDAFLWMSTRDGYPLEREMMFVEYFNCLKGMLTCD
jgi:hypothetical protein